MPIDAYADFSSGLNLQDHPMNVPKDESPNCLNVYGGENKNLLPRKGLGVKASLTTFMGAPHQVTVLTAFTPRSRLTPVQIVPSSNNTGTGYTPYLSSLMAGMEARESFFGEWRGTWHVDPYMDVNTEAGTGGTAYKTVMTDAPIPFSSSTIEATTANGSFRSCDPISPLNFSHTGPIFWNPNLDAVSNQSGAGPVFTSGINQCPDGIYQKITSVISLGSSISCTPVTPLASNQVITLTQTSPTGKTRRVTMQAAGGGAYKYALPPNAPEQIQVRNSGIGTWANPAITYASLPQRTTVSVVAVPL